MKNPEALILMTEIKSVLKRTALFGKLDQATLSELAKHTEERYLTPKAVLFVAGEETGGIFVI